MGKLVNTRKPVILKAEVVTMDFYVTMLRCILCLVTES